jgi:choline dehydrogenase-like flavoprotein
MMNAVGGTTLHYFAQAWRLNPWDFKVVSETTRRYGASRLPKGCTVEDWPFAYEELEPYYDKVDYEIGVSGKAGNIKGKAGLASVPRCGTDQFTGVWRARGLCVPRLLHARRVSCAGQERPAHHHDT